MATSAPAPPDPQPRRITARRGIIAAIGFFTIAGLLLNALVVNRQAAAATGDYLVSVDGDDIAVHQDGPHSAPTIVLIHGLGGSANWWNPVVPALSTSYRVIRIDLLGHGRSAKPAGGGYSIPEQGRRVGAVLDRLGVTRALVVGHSTGGSVATALAEQRTDLVTALTLVNTGPHRDAFISSGVIGNLLTVPIAGQLLWRFRSDDLIRKSMSSAVTRDIEIPPQLVDDLRGVTYHALTATSQESTAYLEQRALPDRLTALNKPLLVIFGEEDRRWRSSSATNYRAVPGARVDLLPGIGHSPMLEDPSRTAAILLEFSMIHTSP
ncbi:alpha/beta fold hydrolase [Nocardia sp. NPDC050406]|uniref:alpha/beta fold hydrolase n=1 Tax=Nocardia sp. NPDC050406 TaxID=3364318 RepID=UPI003794FB63